MTEKLELEFLWIKREGMVFPLICFDVSFEGLGDFDVFVVFGDRQLSFERTSIPPSFYKLVSLLNKLHIRVVQVSSEERFRQFSHHHHHLSCNFVY